MRSSWLYLATPVGARQRAGLDLQRVGADRDVGDGVVLGLARAVRDHGAIGRAPGEHMASNVSVSVPIWFTLTRRALAAALGRCRGRDLRVGDEQIVADKLDLLAELRGSGPSSRPSRPPARPSSMETIGYVAASPPRKSANPRPSVDQVLSPSSPYLPPWSNSEAAGSSAITTSRPGRIPAALSIAASDRLDRQPPPVGRSGAKPPSSPTGVALSSPSDDFL